ncbi:MAG: fluoride efflux transporter CrcB [Raoultibacter sp.]
MLFNILAVAAGGAIGASSRYGIGLFVGSFIPAHHALAGFPLATLLVNSVGCFVIGFASHFFTQTTMTGKDLWQLFCITGVLGGFTTFSTFSLESITLLQGGNTAAGCLYIALSLLSCLVGVFLGRTLAQLIWRV